jgi:hypothetical protein
MRTSSDLIVDVRRSLCLTAGMAGVLAGVAIALYLAASGVAGRGAGVVAALAGVVLLVVCTRHRARREPCVLTLRGDGSVDWIDRRGVRGSGQVVGAGRMGGLCVSLRIASRATPQDASRRGGGRLRWLAVRKRHTWLIPADALDAETFRVLAVRAPRLAVGRR